MENKLSIIVKESGLEKTKAQVLLDNFSDYFQVAAEWETRARTINVTDIKQVVDMQMAKVGRLFLREKRIAIEKTRKELKEQSLREGKAIDGIANVLKALIVPIEEHLEKQEKFIEIKQAEEAERLRIEEEEKVEAERIAKEKAEEEERIAKEKAAEAERIRIKKENERLEKEAEAREKKMMQERVEAEKARKIQEEKARKEKEESDRKIKAEQELREKEKREAEQKQRAYEEKVRLANIENEKRLAELAEQKAKLIECPYCHKTFSLKENN